MSEPRHAVDSDKQGKDPNCAELAVKARQALPRLEENPLHKTTFQGDRKIDADAKLPNVISIVC